MEGFPNNTGGTPSKRLSQKPEVKKDKLILNVNIF